MPYKSEKQRAYLHAEKPAVAAKFDRDIAAHPAKNLGVHAGRGTLVAHHHGPEIVTEHHRGAKRR